MWSSGHFFLLLYRSFVALFDHGGFAGWLPGVRTNSILQSLPFQRSVLVFAFLRRDIKKVSTAALVQSP
jgi:coproporphyrinogen III oxidase